ncbi:MAG: von Willebrand factor type A domain-containing protein, partial [Flavobacteriaceae bacterium]
MKKQLLIFAMMCCVFEVGAQLQTISGTVSDPSGPLPGANVVVKGTTNGTQTDFDGHYTIKAQRGSTLVFNYIGFKTMEVMVKEQSIINVTLEEDAQALDEVVVVGYGTLTRRSLTASVASVSQTKRRQKRAYHKQLSQQLNGQVAGVNIVSSSATQNPNKVKIRGVASLNSSKEPLYIVDGTPIKKQYNKVIADLKPDQIDKINVYKGAKARQLFGSVAKDGCIVISTKKGNYQLENDESYAKITENTFQKVALNPLSTFSIDVDKASYSNIRRLINNGGSVPIDAVKLEEMINYFEYYYPQPKDEHPFSINTEVAQTPWNRQTRLLRIGLQGRSFENEALPASNLTFLIDVSGSMNSPNKLPLLKAAFKLLVNQLREKDKVAIVVYAGAAGVVLEPTSGAEKFKIVEALDQLYAGGSTAGGEGIELAYAIAQKNFIKEGNNRVILATDGDFNVGVSSDRAMEKLIEEKRKTGVFLSVLGFGMGNYKDSKLEVLADKGNGNHAYIDNMQEAQKVFGKEFGGTLFTIAKDVKIQLEFNPSKVAAYRLLGYENRLLEAEDFIDDTKDAGELGSGHTVTALYEIIPVGIQSEYLK